ncbi:MAG: YdcF family protein [Corynebacterium nuruki]|nr:YdcF family protein [Corynebacterium nuruki]
MISGSVLVSVLLILLAGVTAWSVKTRSRWAGNGWLMLALAELAWLWMLVIAGGVGVAGWLWVTFALVQVFLVAVGVLVARWMGDALPGVDGRGWFHLSTVVAAAGAFSLGIGAVVLLARCWRGLADGAPDGNSDGLVALIVLGVVGLLVWAGGVFSLLKFVRDVRRGRHRAVPRRADAVIVLGAGLVHNRVSDLLACRCDRGADAWWTLTAAAPASRVPLIVTGGRGEDEPCTEAEAMHLYLSQRGIPRRAVLEEDRATDTTENLHFSLDLLADRGVRDPHVVVCTSDFHVLRTERIVDILRAERGAAGRPFGAVVLGAPTPKPSIPASYLREFVALTIHRLLGRA